MTEPKKCLKCGTELPPDAPGGHCPQCLLQLGLKTGLTDVLPVLEKSGDWIGRYKLLQQIGEGGCGVVYMAEQEEPVRRRVALKVIKLGMDTKSVIARFEAERQALALMDHPNIAKVFDAGATDTGRPYFVMELVRGIKITEYCDAQKLSVRQRLDLFIQVCQAIQHAHQKGIIHRDIKPSNVLVTEQDGAAVPKIIDFGIAKATTGERLTDKTLFTAFEQFLGTPAYMSPEQAGLGGLDIDTRSDIYSLGVLLYELLTGHQPFDSAELRRAALDEILRTLREKEPPRPSARLTTLTEQELTLAAERHQTAPAKLSSQLRGDLDWIVMKALDKDRRRRYETVTGFSADIQRHLNSEPVTARPPSNLYRFQKMVRRNRLAFTAAGAFLTLAVVLGVSTWLFIQEKRAVQLREYEKFLQEEGGDKNGVSLEYQEDEKRKLLALQKGILGNGSQEVADTLAELSDLLLAEKNFPEAESAARESIAAYKKTSDYGQFRYNGILATLGKILWQENKMAEAEDVARESVAELKKRDTGEMGSLDRLYAGLGLLAGILWDEGKSAQAQAVYDEGFKVQSDFYKAAQIREQEQKIKLEQAQQVEHTNQQVQSPEQYVFRQTNVVQIIPSWGNLIDPEGGSTVKSANGALAVSIPGTIHPIGELTAFDIDGTTTNSVFYFGHEIHILQEMKGDFTVQVKVLSKYERELKTEYNDINIFTSAGLLLLDGTNNIHFCSMLSWSDEFQTLEAPFVSLDYNLSSYKEKFASPYMQLGYHNYLGQFVIGKGFDGKFSYLRMSRNGQMLKMAISRDGIGWLEMFTLPLPPSEKVTVGVEASHNSHNTATVEFSEFKLTHDTPEEAKPRAQ